MNPQEIGAWAGAVVGLITLLGLCRKLVIMPLWESVANARRQQELWQRREENLQWVVDSLRPNGGTSLTDRLTRIESMLVEMKRVQHAMILLDSSGIFITNSSGDWETVNRAWGEMTGFSPDQARGQGWVSAVHADDQERVWKAWAAAVAQKREFSLQYRYQRRGQPVHVYCHAIPMHADDGSIMGWVGMVENVSGGEVLRRTGGRSDVE